MPYVEFVLHIEADALRQLEAAEAIQLGMSGDPQSELRKVQLRRLASG